jgi:hypothetical protein
MMHPLRSLTLIIGAAALTACGGGGGGNGAAPAPQVQAPVPPVVAPAPPVVPPVPVPPPAPVFPYALSPDPLAILYTEGTSVTFVLSGVPKAPLGLTYIKIEPGSTSVVAPQDMITSAADGSFAVELATGVYTPPGVEEGTIGVKACSDIGCGHPLGPTLYFRYRLRVVPKDVEPYAAYARPLTPLAGADIWATLQGNASHTGFVPVTLSPADFSPRYRLRQATPKVIDAPLSDLAASAGLFYYSVGGRCCSAPEYATYARREDSAAIAWWKEWGGIPNYPAAAYAPAVAGDRLYVVGGELASLSVYVIDVNTHAYLGQYFAPGYGNRSGPYPAPTVFDGIVYSPADADSTVLAGPAGTIASYLYGSGQPASGWTPAVDERYLYQYLNNTLYVSNRKNSGLAYIIPGPAQSRGAPAGPAVLRASATTVFGIDEENVVAFDMTALKTRWSTSGNFNRNPAYADGKVFIPNDLTRTLDVRDADTGALLWSWQPIDRPADFGSDVLVTNNLVIVSTKLATYAIDRTTHATVWSYPAAGTLALSPNGTLFIKGSLAVIAIALH